MGADYFARTKRHPDRTRYAVRLHASPEAIPGAPAGSIDTCPPLHPSPDAESLPVALLCCGPSLAITWNDERDFPRHSLVIAVNDAGWRLRCHWLVFSDQHIWEPIWKGEALRPLVGVLTNLAFCQQAPKLGLRAIRPDSFNDDESDGTKGTSYSMNAALWFGTREAQRRGTHVEIHGYDCTRGPSLHGINRPSTHTAARWRSEAQFMRKWWNREIVCHGQAPAALLSYLRGEGPLPKTL